MISKELQEFLEKGLINTEITHPIWLDNYFNQRYELSIKEIKNLLQKLDNVEKIKSLCEKTLIFKAQNELQIGDFEYVGAMTLSEKILNILEGKE